MELQDSGGGDRRMDLLLPVFLRARNLRSDGRNNARSSNYKLSRNLLTMALPLPDRIVTIHVIPTFLPEAAES